MSQGHLQGQISRIPILTNKARNMCNITFHGILSEKSIYYNILLIQANLQGQEVISKVKDKMAVRYFKVKYDFSTNEARNKCNTLFSCDFDWETISSTIFMTQGLAPSPVSFSFVQFLWKLLFSVLHNFT